MPIFNDLNLDNWKESEIWTDSLWIIPERDKSGKHDGFYHGNFVPQIPRQLILRYTKKEDVVFDPFVGSGTTAYEAEGLGRHSIGVDIQPELIEYI
ncbi:MAG: DNA methyltransferase, partial [Patescibacteria group bacterium]